MKIKVEVTLDVNAEAWADEFCLDVSDVCEDVKIYFAETCDEQLRILGCRALPTPKTNRMSAGMPATAAQSRSIMKGV